MGWSCRADAGNVLNAWQDVCHTQTGATNVYETTRGRYMFEVSHTEHDDGSITGTILKFIVGGRYDGRVKSSGSFRIAGDGSIVRGPKILKTVAKGMKPAEHVGIGSNGRPLFELI